MKRIAKISVISLASLLMLVLSALPHHHHNDGAPCFISEQKDHICDIQHVNRHNPTSDKSSEKSNCVVHANFIAQQTESGGRLKSFTPANNLDNLFHPSLLMCILWDLNIPLPEEKPDYSEFILTFSLYESRTPIGLRAPPSYFL